MYKVPDNGVCSGLDQFIPLECIDPRTVYLICRSSNGNGSGFKAKANLNFSITDYKKLLAEHRSNADKTTILLLADQESRHGKVVTLMDLARDAGFVKLAIATEQRKK